MQLCLRTLHNIIPDDIPVLNGYPIIVFTFYSCLVIFHFRFKLKMSCCAAPVDMSDKTYYAAVEHEVFVEKKVELGPKKHSRHIMSWLPKTTAKAVVVIAHGLHEHGMRYYTVAHALTGRKWLSLVRTIVHDVLIG
jgi:hypothetical protein